jgi:hypothetical protein
MFRNMLTVGIVFFVLCPSIVASVGGIRTERPFVCFDQNGRSGTADIPTWYQGDEWTYTIDPLYYSSMNGSFSGSIQN